ncbi:hypothetical protein ACLMJK_009221 [Lecanora helva]
MFKVFSSAEKPTASHNRSKTQPHIPHHSGNIDTPSSSIATVNGQQFCFVEPPSTHPIATTQHEPFFSAPLTEPTKTHPRNLAEQVRLTRDLPPLMIKAAESDVNRKSQDIEIPSIPSPHQGSQQQRSPEPSRQSSPTRASEKASKLANWFKGESEPISIGFLPSPVKEKVDPFDNTRASSEIRPTALLQRMSTASTISRPAMAGRFSFFTNKGSSSKPIARPLDLDDEFIDMDIGTALLPTGSPDPSSPAALKNLQQQAESLLLRLQTAYKERTITLRDMVAEKEALAEETEGAETRARHLKTQLDDLSAKLAEQDEAMMNLVDQLAQEKLARQEENEARKRSVRLVEHATPTNTSQRRRTLSDPVSDSGFESGDDSSAESVFSRRSGAHSPAFSMSSVSTNNSPDVHPVGDHQSPMSLAQSERLRDQPTTTRKEVPISYQNQVARQQARSNRQNRNTNQNAEAWNTIYILQEENKFYKKRVGELEDALDGCLDLVGTLS